MVEDSERQDPQGVEHPFFILSRASLFLGATLRIDCDSESNLVIPKSFSAGLLATVLLDTYLNSIAASLWQFHHDIDTANEHTPDAKSLVDFHEFAEDISEQCGNCINPLALTCRHYSFLSEICRSAKTSVSSFASAARRKTRDCAEKLCEVQRREFCGRKCLDQLAVLQSLSFEKRIKQQPHVRPTLDDIQTDAGEAAEGVDALISRVRIESGRLRRHLSTAEKICNNPGNLKSQEVSDAFREVHTS